MNNYPEQLEALHNAMVRDNRQPMLELVKPVRGNIFTPAQRVAVYADGYAERLVDAALSDYPALAHHMGADAIRDAMHAFVNETPSRFWDMNHYPPAFAQFLKARSADLAACALAELESAITQVFWAPEAASLKATSLATLSEEAFGATVFTFIPACRLLTLDYNANTYLTTFRATGVAPVMQCTAEYLLIVRYDNEVQRVVLEPEEYALLSALHAGADFNDALAMQKDPAALVSKLPAYLQLWLQYGIFAA